MAIFARERSRSKSFTGSSERSADLDPSEQLANWFFVVEFEIR